MFAYGLEVAASVYVWLVGGSVEYVRGYIEDKQDERRGWL